MERDRQDRHETPSGVRYNETETRRYEGSLVDTRPIWQAHQIPDTPYEAIQNVAPHQTIPLDYQKLDRDSLNEALKVLSEKELAVIELVVFGGMSLREAGMWLARDEGRSTGYCKQTVSNVRNSALKKLRVHYENR